MDGEMEGWMNEGWMDGYRDRYPTGGLPDGPRGKKKKETPARQGTRLERWEFHPWVGRSPGGGQGGPLQHSCLENPIDRGAWWATVQGVTKSRTRLSD